MEHRALATLLCLTCFACGFDAADASDASTASPLGHASEADAEVPFAEPVAVDGVPFAEPVADDVPLAAPEPQTAPEPPTAPEPSEVARPESTAARLDTTDPLSTHRVLPAVSADGRLILTVRYEQASDSLFVDVVRASNQRRVRSIELPLSGTEAALDAAVESVDRMLARRGFTTFRALEPVMPDAEVEAQEYWDGWIDEWTDGELSVHYDAATGGLAVYRGYALVHQSLVPARVPDGPGVGLMDPDYAELTMIPNADDVRISADGRMIAVRLAACDCSCDIEPFWKIVAL